MIPLYRPLLVCLVTVCTVLLTLFLPSRAFAADAVVGNGTPASCTEAALTDALDMVQSSGGGTITFNCGTVLQTIPFTTYHAITGKVIIDGEKTIALDGGGTSAFFQIAGTGDLTLRNMLIQDGAFADVHPLENFGVLLLEKVTLQKTLATDSLIYNQGMLTIRNSQVAANVISDGGQGAGLQNDAGTVTIEASAFISNSIDGTLGNGGAIANLNGTVAISKTYFISNHAARGGAIYTTGTSTTTVERSLFTQNYGGEGGAFLVASDNTTLAISDTTVHENTALSGAGGAVTVVTGTLTVDTSQFSSNRAATMGGAIHCGAGSLTVTRSSVTKSSAGTNGGGIYTTCALSLLNSTLSGNQATGGGGAIFEATPDPAVVGYATIMENTAEYGAGIYAEGQDSTRMVIAASVVGYNTGGNCDGVFFSEGYNFTNDTGCSAFTQVGDQQAVALPFSAVGYYGGLTLSYVPFPGNPAIDAIPAGALDDIVGIAVDQRGVNRPQGAGLDSGAVERAPEGEPNPAWRVYLAVIRK